MTELSQTNLGYSNTLALHTQIDLHSLKSFEKRFADCCEKVDSKLELANSPEAVLDNVHGYQGVGLRGRLLARSMDGRKCDLESSPNGERGAELANKGWFERKCAESSVE